MAEQTGSRIDDDGPEREGVRLLFTRDIARLRDVDVSAARKWLVATEEKHGTAVVGRIGNRLYTTSAAMLSIAPQWKGPAGDHDGRIRALEESVSTMSKRLRVIEAELTGRSIASGATPNPALSEATRTVLARLVGEALPGLLSSKLPALVRRMLPAALGRLVPPPNRS